jgi:hypothetical protein
VAKSATSFGPLSTPFYPFVLAGVIGLFPLEKAQCNLRLASGTRPDRRRLGRVERRAG